MTAIINITITITIMIIGIMMINCKKLKKENSPVTLISISSTAPACAAVLWAVCTLNHQDDHYDDFDDETSYSRDCHLGITNNHLPPPLELFHFTIFKRILHVVHP